MLSETKIILGGKYIVSINSQLERLALEYSASIREEDVTLKEQEEIMNSEWFISWMKEYHQ